MSPEHRMNHPHERGVEGEGVLKNCQSRYGLKACGVKFTTLNMKDKRMWSLPSRSLRVARSVASRESGSTLDIFTFHSYKESFTSSTWNFGCQ